MSKGVGQKKQGIFCGSTLKLAGSQTSVKDAKPPPFQVDTLPANSQR